MRAVVEASPTFTKSEGIGLACAKVMGGFRAGSRGFDAAVSAADGALPELELRGEAAKRYCAEIVIAYLTDHASASVGEIAALLDVQVSRAQAVLDSLLQWKIATKDGNGENAVYRLSS